MNNKWQRLGLIPPRNELRHYIMAGYSIGLPEPLGDLILKEHQELENRRLRDEPDG